MDEDLILEAVTARVAALGLLFEGQPVTIQKRKTPKRLKDDPPVMVNVCKSGTPENNRKWTNQHTRHQYFTEISIIASNDGDQLTTLPDHTLMRQTIINAFRKKPADLMGLDNLRDVAIKEKDFLPRDMLGKNVDYQALDVMVEIVEEH